MDKFEKPRAYKNCNSSEIGKTIAKSTILDKLFNTFKYLYSFVNTKLISNR